MATNQRYNRRWAARNFVAGGVDVIDLPLGFDIETLLLSLSGTINLTAAATGVRAEGLAKLIKRVSVMQDGKSIMSFTGDFITHGNFAREGGVIKTNPGIGIATHVCRVTGALDFAHIGGVRPSDSNLKTAGGRQLQLHITYGTLADLFTGAPVGTFALTLSVAVRETKELKEDAPYPAIQRVAKFIERPYAASQEDRIPLDPNCLYRGIMLRCEAAGELSAAVLNRVKVMFGSDGVIDYPVADIVDMNILDLGFTLTAGYYWVDFAPSPTNLAKVSDFLDTYNRADVFLVLDVNGGATNKVQIVPHQFEWIKYQHVDNSGYGNAAKIADPVRGGLFGGARGIAGRLRRR